MQIFHSRSPYSRFSVDPFKKLFIHISQSINKLGLISFIGYLLNTSVTFIHVVFSYVPLDIQLLQFRICISLVLLCVLDILVLLFVLDILVLLCPGYPSSPICPEYPSSPMCPGYPSSSMCPGYPSSSMCPAAIVTTDKYRASYSAMSGVSVLRIIWFCCFYNGVIESCLQRAASFIFDTRSFYL